MRDIRISILGEISYLTDHLELYDPQGAFNKDDLHQILLLIRVHAAFDNFCIQHETDTQYKKERTK